MSRAEIYLEDTDVLLSGDQVVTAAVKFNFPGGFDPASPAHQLCNIVRKYLEATLTQASEPVAFGDTSGIEAHLASLPDPVEPVADDGKGATLVA